MGVNAQQYGYFFNSTNNDRTYNAESFEAWIKPLLSNGVFSTGMKVSAQSTPDMSVSVATGYANINGKVACWASDNTLSIATAPGTYPRIDTVVLRRDNTNRKISLEVVTGTPASTPSAPAPTRTGDVYELVIAQIYVGVGVTSIANANITDTRTNTTLCGLVTCPIENPDFSDLYDQFTDQFETWFDHMKDQLDSDAAGHLQQEIDDLDADVVKVSSQSLTSTQKGQARTNINAADDSDVVKLSSQNLTSTQAVQVHTNLKIVYSSNTPSSPVTGMIWLKPEA